MVVKTVILYECEICEQRHADPTACAACEARGIIRTYGSMIGKWVRTQQSRAWHDGPTTFMLEQESDRTHHIHRWVPIFYVIGEIPSKRDGHVRNIVLYSPCFVSGKPITRWTGANHVGVDLVSLNAEQESWLRDNPTWLDGALPLSDPFRIPLL